MITECLCDWYVCVLLIKCVCVLCMSLAGNRALSFFPGKHCWVRSGVYNYTWVPISSLRAFFSGSPNNTNSCVRGVQPAGSQTTHPELGSQWRPALLGLPRAMCNPTLSFSPLAAGCGRDPWVSTNKFLVSARLCSVSGVEENKWMTTAKPGMSKSFTWWDE